VLGGSCWRAESVPELAFRVVPPQLSRAIGRIKTSAGDNLMAVYGQ
jgi:hypothetical protein